MKFVHMARMTLLLVAAAPCIASAQPGGAAGAGGAAEFAQHRQHELARIAERIQALQTLQGCVQAAADHNAIKACNENARAAMKGHAG